MLQCSIHSSSSSSSSGTGRGRMEGGKTFSTLRYGEVGRR